MIERDGVSMKFAVGEEVKVINSVGTVFDGGPVKKIAQDSAGDYRYLVRGVWRLQDELEKEEQEEGGESKDEDKEEFSTGAVRDSQVGKSRPDFIDPRFLLRLGEHLRKGAEKYSDFNFDNGIPSQRYMASLQRHLFQYYSGDRSEDHLAAVVFNAIGIASNEGTNLDDLHIWAT